MYPYPQISSQITSSRAAPPSCRKKDCTTEYIVVTVLCVCVFSLVKDSLPPCYRQFSSPHHASDILPLFHGLSELYCKPCVWTTLSLTLRQLPGTTTALWVRCSIPHVRYTSLRHSIFSSSCTNGVRFIFCSFVSHSDLWPPLATSSCFLHTVGTRIVTLHGAQFTMCSRSVVIPWGSFS
jgi:hypothetical protein